jgi:hypothetical protein
MATRGWLQTVVCGTLALPLLGENPVRAGGDAVVRVETPMTPPAWALLERELLRAQTIACREFFDRYFDDRGFLECVERWGGDDGPDDAIENVNDWPILHALGASDEIRLLYEKAWEGHLRQYTKARTVEVEFARDGMYYKEFPVMFDWVHNGEGLTVFAMQSISDPSNRKFQQRARRFAGLYMNEDPQAPNYDPKHRIIRSLFNGSRGPLLRKATGLDWAGDPIEVENRFRPGHGEHSYRQMVEHFKDYNDIVGDHPQNMSATSLALNAYMLSHEPKYKEWLLDYVGAWRQRMLDNGGIIPTNIGLDGKIGSEAGGKWYGGVYGWGFTVMDPATGKPSNRNTHYLGLVGFTNAYLLTGDDRFLDPWRKQIETINAQKKVVDGRTLYPHMYGDKGWYDYTPQPYSVGVDEIYLLSMAPEDRKRIQKIGWIAFLEGEDPGYPERALRSDFSVIRKKVEGFRHDPTTPDTRLADDPMAFNPATVGNLINLMLGGLHPGHRSSALHCRVRYFDPVARRAGVPADVAALVERLSADETVVVLVNVSPSEPRIVTVQGGAYGEHQIQSVSIDGRTQDVNRRTLEVRLDPGAGARMTLKMKRYANPPTLMQPWDQQER